MQEAMDAKRRASTREAIRTAGLSGAATGGSLALAAKLWGGSRSKAELLKAALTGAGLYGGASAAATAAGSSIMGAPEEDDPTGFTRRGVVGGGALGAGVGAGLGALATMGKVKLPNNLIGDYFKKLALAGGPSALKKGAAIGGLGLGTLGAYLGADEGMQADVVTQELVRKRRRALEEAGYGPE